MEYIGLWCLLALTLNMWALLSVIPSGASLTAKAIWAICLALLPGIGFIVWFLIGPRRAG